MVVPCESIPSPFRFLHSQEKLKHLHVRVCIYRLSHLFRQFLISPKRFPCFSAEQQSKLWVTRAPVTLGDLTLLWFNVRLR